MAAHTYLTVQGRGVVTLPADLRRRHHLDEPGAQLEVTEREDGVIELRAKVPVDADQAWFWTERWQTMEREVDEHVERGQLTVSDDAEELVDDLDRLRAGD